MSDFFVTSSVDFISGIVFAVVTLIIIIAAIVGLIKAKHEKGKYNIIELTKFQLFQGDQKTQCYIFQ